MQSSRFFLSSIHSIILDFLPHKRKGSERRIIDSFKRTSHHPKVMKNDGLGKMRKEETKNYYYFDPERQSSKSHRHAESCLGNSEDNARQEQRNQERKTRPWNSLKS